MPGIRIVPTQGPPVALTGGSIHLGREASCELVIRDTGASRRHARIEADDAGGFLLVDLGSANGTFVNGVRRERVQLDVGDWIQIGRERFHVEDGEVEGGTEFLELDSLPNRAAPTVHRPALPTPPEPPAPPPPARPAPPPPVQAAPPPPPARAPSPPAPPPVRAAAPPPPVRATAPPPPPPPPPSRPRQAPAPAAQAPDPKVFFLLKDGRMEKLHEAEVRAKLSSGQLAPEEMAWRGGLDGWKPLSTFSELRGGGVASPSAPPPPVPRRR